MKVQVAPCFGGSLRHRLEFMHGGQLCVETVRTEVWDRKAATEALDILQYVYGVNRRNVRFEIY